MPPLAANHHTPRTNKGWGGGIRSELWKMMRASITLAEEKNVL
jgi:hypothetical protein